MSGVDRKLKQLALLWLWESIESIFKENSQREKFIDSEAQEVGIWYVCNSSNPLLIGGFTLNTNLSEAPAVSNIRNALPGVLMFQCQHISVKKSLLVF